MNENPDVPLHLDCEMISEALVALGKLCGFFIFALGEKCHFFLMSHPGCCAPVESLCLPIRADTQLSGPRCSARACFKPASHSASPSHVFPTWLYLHPLPSLPSEYTPPGLDVKLVLAVGRFLSVWTLGFGPWVSRCPWRPGCGRWAARREADCSPRPPAPLVLRA